MPINIDLLICCITVLGTVAVTAYTYFQAKKLKFFETIFNEKVKAYSEFLETMSNAIENCGIDNIRNIIAAQLKVKLYCSKKAYPEITKVVNSFLDLEIPDNPNANDLVSFGLEFEKAVTVFRDDLKNCRRFKFD